MSDQELLALVEAKNEHIEVLEQRIRDIKLAFNESHEKGFREPLTDAQINEMAHKQGDYDSVFCCWMFNSDTACRYNLINFVRDIERTLATRWGVKLKGSDK